MKRRTVAVHSGKWTGRRINLSPEGVLFGSDGTAVARLEEPGVAAFHARLGNSVEGVWLEVLDGPVQIDGRLIKGRVELKCPVRVKLGDVVLEIEEWADDESGESTQVLDFADSDRFGKTVPFFDLSSENGSDVTLPMGVAAQETGWDEAPIQGGYRLGEELARGGMGRIYFGEDWQLKRQVAVKVSSTSGAGVEQRFVREAEVLAQLAHPNIVPVYSQGVDVQGRRFYAMKLVKGRTLQAVLNGLRAGAMEMRQEYPLAALLTVFRKVCDGVAFAHSKGVLHRDLKPENIMLGEYGEVLVMDWGLARVRGSLEKGIESDTSSFEKEENSDLGRTLEGSVMGTPQYMSPEQAEGMVADLDERSDVYSLGAILYAVLTRRAPVEGKTVHEVLTRVRSGEISPMGREGVGSSPDGAGVFRAEPGIPEALKAVVFRALARKREDRYGSVTELGLEIEAYQNGFATRAEAAGLWRQLGLFVRRNRGGSSVAGVLLVMAVVFTVRLGMAKQLAQANERRARENERRAVDAREMADLEAARAQIALAEAAEETGDSEQIRLALSRVPERFRDQNWEYLESRMDAADLKVPAPAGAPWKEVDDCPLYPEWVLALHSNGQISRVHLSNGEVVPLWKGEKAGWKPHSFSVSQSGEQLALVWEKEAFLEMEVRAVVDGRRIGEPVLVDHTEDPNSLFRSRTLVRISDKELFVWSHSKEFGERLECLEIGSGKHLWKAEGIRGFTLSPEGKDVWAFDTEGRMLRFSSGQGTVEWRSTEKRIGVESFFPGNIWMDAKGTFALVARYYGDRFVRWYDEQSGQTKWEIRCNMNAPMVVRPSKDLQTVAVLGERSVLGWVMEIRKASTGDLIRTYPFQRKLRDSGGYRRLASGGDSFAMAFQDRIMVWNFGIQKPLARLEGMPLAGGERVVRSLPADLASELSILDWKKNKLASLFIEGFGRNRAASISQNRTGTRLALRHYEKVGAYQIQGDKIEEVWGPRILPGAAFAVHPSEDLLWIGDRILEFSTGKEVQVLEKSGGQLLALSGAVNRSGGWVGQKHVVAPVVHGAVNEGEAEEERALVLWNAETGRVEARSPAPRVLDLAVTTDGTWIAEAGDDRKVRIRNGATLVVERELRAHDSEVDSVVWHPRLPILVTHARGQMRLWDSRSWRMIEAIRVEQGKGILWIAGHGKQVAIGLPTGTLFFAPAAFQE